MELVAIEALVHRAVSRAERAAWAAHAEGRDPGGADAELGRLARDAELVASLAGEDPRAVALRGRLARARLARPRLPRDPREPAWRRALAQGSREEREAAWRARVQATARFAPVLLVRLRLDRAEVLAAEGLDEARVQRAFAELDALTAPLWRPAGDAPWDLEPPAARFEGRPALTPPCRVDEPVGEGAATYLVDPPHDVRVVAAEPDGDAAGWLTYAHELGHAAYATGHAVSLPWSLRDAPAPWLHEAVAQHAALQLGRGWPGAEAARAQLVLGARLRLVHAAVERAVHAGEAPEDAHHDACRRYLAVELPAGPAWTRLTFLAERPGAGARYLVGEAAAWQLPASGWQARLFAAGASRPAEALLAEARRT